MVMCGAGHRRATAAALPEGRLEQRPHRLRATAPSPVKSFTAPFHLAIDQLDRIWVSDSSFHVIRFPVADPTKAVKFDVRSNNSGLNIDSQGNVWVTNRFGPGLLGMRTWSTWPCT